MDSCPLSADALALIRRTVTARPSDREAVRAAQQQLAGAGFDVGKAGADGRPGADTVAALEAAERAAGVGPSPPPTPSGLDTLALSRVLAACGVPAEKRATFTAPLVTAMREAGITTRLRISHFLAQLLHESAAFRYTEEIASGQDYEGRRDLGNTVAGDGRRFKGRGLIQLTGRANYAAFGRAVGVDVLARPHLVAELPLAVQTATWYWTTRRLNDLADQGDTEAVLRAVTRKVNGGYNGIEDRLRYFMRAGAALRAEGVR